jgi:hypothetical protein
VPIEIEYRKSKVIRLEDGAYGVQMRFRGADGLDYTSTVRVGSRYSDDVTVLVRGIEDRADEARDRRHNDVWERT